MLLEKWDETWAGGEGKHKKGEQEKPGGAVEEQVKGLVASGKSR